MKLTVLFTIVAGISAVKACFSNSGNTGNTQSASTGNTDPECLDYDHPNYGCNGKCVSTSSCPGSNYVSGLCPSQASNIKCCFTSNTDSACLDYGGSCVKTSSCSWRISNLCPYQPLGVECCLSQITCDESTHSIHSSSCGYRVKTLACDVLELHNSNSNSNSITLLNSHPSGVIDGAYPYSNIVDTCNGLQAKRSSYSCNSGRSTSPGGSTCLTEEILEYIKQLPGISTNRPQINSIAGACHSTTSKHYQGTAVDLQFTDNAVGIEDAKAWMGKCTELGGSSFGPDLGVPQYPGHAGHSRHIHCQFS